MSPRKSQQSGKESSHRVKNPGTRRFLASLGSRARGGLEKRSLVSEPTLEKIRLMKKKVVSTWRVYKGNPMGVIGLVMLLFFVIMAVFAPQFMALMGYISEVEGHPWPMVYGPFNRLLNDTVYEEPSWEHWMGTDQLRRDILARTVYGTRVSLEIGLVATVVSMGLGTVIGLLSGYWGGWRDEALMRLTDVFLVLPWLVLMIVLASLLPGGPSVWKVIFVIGITGWSSTARIVRAQVLSLKERTFVERARAVGSGDMHIVSRHIFPNVFPLVFANSILTVAISILSESTLSFVGLGPPPNEVVTWGNVLNEAYNRNAIINGLYLWIVIPGLCIVALVLAFTFIGYALDEIFNPKLRRR